MAELKKVVEEVNEEEVSWKDLVGSFLADLQSSRLARCQAQSDESGHDFMPFPPFSRASMDGIKIVAICKFCGKAVICEVDGLAKISVVSRQDEQIN